MRKWITNCYEGQEADDYIERLRAEGKKAEIGPPNQQYLGTSPKALVGIYEVG